VNEHNTVSSDRNVFGSQKARQEDEIFSIGLEYLAGNAKMAFFTECVCLFFIWCIVMLCDSFINFMLPNIIKNC